MKANIIQISIVFYFSIIISILIIPRWNAVPFYFIISNNDFFEQKNIIPFKTIIEQINEIIDGKEIFYNFKNLVGNIVLFIPFPISLKLTNNKLNILSCLIISVLFSVTVEFIQSFIGRIVDIDDIILNSLGSLLGALLYKLYIKYYPYKLNS